MLTDAKRESLKTGDRFWCVTVGKPTRRLFGELVEAELTDLVEVIFLREHPSNARKENDPIEHAYAIAYADNGRTDTMVDQLCFDTYNEACTAVLESIVKEIDGLKAKAVRFEEVRVAALEALKGRPSWIRTRGCDVSVDPVTRKQVPGAYYLECRVCGKRIYELDFSKDVSVKNPPDACPVCGSKS